MSHNKPLCFYIVQGGRSEQDVVTTAGHTYTTDITKADALLLTGGGDIPTTLYNQNNVASHSSPWHDAEDYKATAYWEQNKRQFRLLAGICRGGQWLNCISGGSMWQDVDKHHGSHLVTDQRTGETITINSVHHQMMRPSKEAEILAVATPMVATKLTDDTGVYSARHLENHQDIEALWYPNTNSLCFQAHPEYGHKPTTDYFIKLLNEKFNEVCNKESS